MVKGGFQYGGSGIISVAGGDQIWLAINKTLIFEITTDPDATEIPCMTIDLSPASNGGKRCHRLKKHFLRLISLHSYLCFATTATVMFLKVVIG